MRGWILGALAAASMFATGAAEAATMSGTLSGNFTLELWQTPAPGRTVRVDFDADLSGVQNTYLTLYQEVWRFGNYSPDTYELFQNLGSYLTPTGFSVQLVADTGDMCDSGGYCTRRFVRGLTLQGNAAAGPVDYDVSVRAVPEPTTWALMIAGFGAAGVALRRRAATA